MLESSFQPWALFLRRFLFSLSREKGTGLVVSGNESAHGQHISPKSPRTLRFEGLDDSVCVLYILSLPKASVSGKAMALNMVPIALCLQMQR
ncbi:MAG TPA: hypothetical protein IAC11_01130 [Candidatus Limiplasma pullicola]|nr:hypothetical protein [Candidatus Limiplasma pullicola]